jgi:hypothetical protein
MKSNLTLKIKNKKKNTLNKPPFNLLKVPHKSTQPKIFPQYLKETIPHHLYNILQTTRYLHFHLETNKIYIINNPLTISTPKIPLIKYSSHLLQSNKQHQTNKINKINKIILSPLYLLRTSGNLIGNF